MPSDTSSLVAEITKIFSGDIDASDVAREKYSRDMSIFAVRPELVVFPKNVNDIAQLVRFVAKSRTSGGEHATLSLSARSGGTDMTGGSLTESIVVDCARYLNRFIEMGDDSALVEPGMYYRDLDAETKKRGLILPSYPASREICTVGGMAANNSGGEKNLMYGKTERYVRSIEMVLDDGSIETFRPLTLTELEAKKNETTRAGEIYRGMYELLRKNTELIRKAKPNVSKNSSGYFLWNVVDEKNGTFDLTKMIVGAQGTLGIMTKLSFGLVHPKPHRRAVTVFLNDLSFLGDLVNHVLSHEPESFESYDDHTFSLAMRFFPKIVKRLKGSIFTLGLSFLPEFWRVATGGIPKLILLIEFSADTEEAAARRAYEAATDINTSFRVNARVLASEAEAEKYWVIRRESFALLRQNVRGLHASPFIDDFVVRPEYLPEFMPKLNTILEKYHLIYTVAGHVGDGNFHIIPLMDLSLPESKEVIRTLSKEVYELVFSYHGVITGEHNDGIIRTPYLSQEFGAEVYRMFEETKKIFDPKNIFNPGKKVGGTLEYAMTHIDARKLG